MEILQIRAFSKRLYEKKRKKESLTILHLYTVCYTLFFEVIFQVHILSLSKLSLYFFFPSKEGKINLSCFVEKVNFTIFRS